MISGAAQTTLFQCQVYHLRQVQRIERELNYRCISPSADAATLKRRLKMHRRFIDALTPLVSAPNQKAKL